MAKILHVVGSPRPGSVSTALSKTFLKAAVRPGDTLDTLDVWAENLPIFGAEAAEGKLKGMSGVALPPAEQAAFDQVLGLVGRLKAADKVVVSAGMWNFGVPYRLKHWVDLVVQAGHTFGFDPATGYFGLVKGRPLQLLLATGGDYAAEGAMASYDMLGPYLTKVFGFMGFEDIRTVTAACTAYPAEVSKPLFEKADNAAADAGAAF